MKDEAAVVDKVEVKILCIPVVPHKAVAEGSKIENL